MSTITRGLCLLLVSASLAGCDKGPTKSDPPSAKAAIAAAPAATPVAPAAPAKLDGTAFGAGVKLAETTPIDTILADPKAFHGKIVRVEGMITDVCPKRGCWFELAGSGPGQKLRFKVTDGEMVFPMDAKGKVAVAEGTVAVKELTLEESKQHAEYQAKEYNIKYDPASITSPTSIVRIDGTGAVFRDKL
ncbi:MAG: DUF4920 domain-containing protein [Myxococcota bacterium]|nr:DUF4920 domain-containing protein [Myxococcota bacterium]